MEEHLLFLGDLYYTYDVLAEDYCQIADWIRRKDFCAVVNLEGCLDVPDAVKISKRGPNMAQGKGYMEALCAINTKGVCLANNHMMDYGWGGLNAVINSLKEAKIPFCGAGANLQEACRPMYLHLAGRNICVLNFGWDVEEVIPATDTAPGCGPLKREIVISAIQKARKECDYLVVCLHWGFEYHRLPLPVDIELAHEMVDHGADLIIGNHPHNIQPKEIYKGKSIYYSLGNFYFSEDRKTFRKKFNERITNQSDYGLMVALDLKNLLCQEYLVIYDHNTDTSQVSEENVGALLEDISGIPYQTRAYANQVRRRKSNYTPVLTFNKKRNKTKLNALFGYYKLKKIAKRILLGKS